ncbi:MAG: dynamin family protein [Muribaculaceae bacterium]|nr:dynamin family protein [Muribaculaceae bacterium]
MSKISEALSAAEKIITRASEYGIDAADFIKKIMQAKAMLDRDTITIAMLGSFSDGKTTIIAGLLGKVLENMKISTNESSDEIIEYDADFMGKRFRFIDTPGLFGTKEKIADGQKIRLSQITEKFISQADIVIYVTEAVNPLPESHNDALRQVMRGLRKLENAVFVINKMDETGCGYASSEGFTETSEIKKINLRKRLERVLDLSPAESSALRIVTLAANPGGKDMSLWFAHADKYLTASNIETLRANVKELTSSLDIDATVKQTALDVAIDSIKGVQNVTADAVVPISKSLKETKIIGGDMTTELSIARDQLMDSKRQLSSTLDSLEESIKVDVSNASVETIGDVIDTLGTTDGKVSLSIVIRKIEDALQVCSESSSSILERTAIKIDEQSSLQQTLLTEGLGKAAGLLKNAKITPEMVGAIRDTFFKNFKFKPWGKINLAGNLTKWIGRIGVGLTIVMEVYGWYKQRKAQEDLKETKQKLEEALTELFNKARDLYRTDEAFFTNFAPVYLELEKRVATNNKEIENMDTKLNNLRSLADETAKWYVDFVEDVDYTEI